MNIKNTTSLILEKVEKLLIEGRLEDVKAKYPQLSWDKIDLISEKDPSGNNKYLDWMVKHIYPKTIKWFKDNASTGGGWYSWTIDEVPDTSVDPRWSNTSSLRRQIDSLNSGDLLKIADDIDYFHSNPSKYVKKDINQYSSLKELEDATNEAKLKLSRKEQKDTGVDKVFEDEDFLILMPKTHKASCRYGSNTRWCVTMRNSSSYFENYFTQGPIFFLIDKRKLAPTNSMDTQNYYKIAMHYRPFGGALDGGGRQALNLAKSKTKEEFVNGANADRTLIDYWNVVDDNKPEKTVLKFLGGPGRGQTKKGTEALAKIKDVMEKYTKKAMGEYYDSLGDISEYVNKLTELQKKKEDLSLKDNNLYYKVDRLENVISRLTSFRDRLDDDDDEPEYKQWTLEQLEKARTFETALKTKRLSVRTEITKIDSEIDEISSKIDSKKLVFYDPDKTVSIR
jgi:hypothetical protein